jgi:Tol biopolymer transport system component
MCNKSSYTFIAILALLFLFQTGNSQSIKWQISNVHPLTDTTISVHYYVWSPDGKKIAMSCSGFDNRLFVIDVITGAKPIYLADNLGATGIQWSPDSKKIVYVTKNPDAEGMKTARDISEGYRWSGMVVDVDTKATEEIAHNDFGFGNPRWHGDGEIVLVKSQTGGEVVTISKWKTDATNKGNDLIRFRFVNGRFLLVKDNVETDFSLPPGMQVISNNGKYLATKGGGGLTIIQLEPPHEERCFGHHLVSPLDWSKDDNHILCIEYPGGEMIIKGERGNIHILDINTGNMQNLTAMHIVGEENMVGYSYPKFSPDGTQVSFICDFYKGPSKLYIADLHRR